MNTEVMSQPAPHKKIEEAKTKDELRAAVREFQVTYWTLEEIARKIKNGDVPAHFAHFWRGTTYKNRSILKIVVDAARFRFWGKVAKVVIVTGAIAAGLWLETSIPIIGVLIWLCLPIKHRDDMAKVLETADLFVEGVNWLTLTARLEPDKEFDPRLSKIATLEGFKKEDVFLPEYNILYGAKMLRMLPNWIVGAVSYAKAAKTLDGESRQQIGMIIGKMHLFGNLFDRPEK